MGKKTRDKNTLALRAGTEEDFRTLHKTNTKKMKLMLNRERMTNKRVMDDVQGANRQALLSHKKELENTRRDCARALNFHLIIHPGMAYFEQLREKATYGLLVEKRNLIDTLLEFRKRIIRRFKTET